MLADYDWHNSVPDWRMFLQRLHSLWDGAALSFQPVRQHFDAYLAPFREQLAPVTEKLPQPLQHFLDAGGWYLLLTLVALIVLSWMWSIGRRIFRTVHSSRRRPRHHTHYRDWTQDLEEDLGPLAITYTEPAAHVLVVKGLPARLRLLVMAPASKHAGPLDKEMADKLLDCIQPGMGEVISADYPRTRIWPPSVSGPRFAKSFRRLAPFPESRRQRAHWALLAGTVSCGRHAINLGLALYTETPNRFGHVHVPQGSWLEYIGLMETDKNS